MAVSWSVVGQGTMGTVVLDSDVPGSTDAVGYGIILLILSRGQTVFPNPVSAFELGVVTDNAPHVGADPCMIGYADSPCFRDWWYPPDADARLPITYYNDTFRTEEMSYSLGGGLAYHMTSYPMPAGTIISYTDVGFGGDAYTEAYAIQVSSMASGDPLQVGWPCNIANGPMTGWIGGIDVAFRTANGASPADCGVFDGIEGADPGAGPPGTEIDTINISVQCRGFYGPGGPSGVDCTYIDNEYPALVSWTIDTFSGDSYPCYDGGGQDLRFQYAFREGNPDCCPTTVQGIHIAHRAKLTE